MLRFMFVGANGIRAGWRLAIFALLVAVLGIVAGRVIALVWHPHVVPSQTSLFASPLLIGLSEGATLLITLAAAVVMGRIERRSLTDYGLPGGGRSAVNFAFGIALGFAAASGLVGLIAIGGGVRFNGATPWSAPLAGQLGAFAVALLLVGATEEFLFRGYVQFTLATGIRFWPAAVVTSLAFAGLHAGNAREQLIGVIGTFLVGLFLCFTLQRSGSLWLGIGFHGAWDVALTSFYGAADSGIPSPVSWLHVAPIGSDWISGGRAGPEGSVLVPLVLLASAAVVIGRYRSSGSTSARAGEDPPGSMTVGQAV